MFSMDLFRTAVLYIRSWINRLYIPEWNPQVDWDTDFYVRRRDVQHGSIQDLGRLHLQSRLVHSNTRLLDGQLLLSTCWLDGTSTHMHLHILSFSLHTLYYLCLVVCLGCLLLDCSTRWFSSTAALHTPSLQDDYNTRCSSIGIVCGAHQMEIPSATG